LEAALYTEGHIFPVQGLAVRCTCRFDRECVYLEVAARRVESYDKARRLAETIMGVACGVYYAGAGRFVLLVPQGLEEAVAEVFAGARPYAGEIMRKPRNDALITPVALMAASIVLVLLANSISPIFGFLLMSLVLLVVMPIALYLALRGAKAEPAGMVEARPAGALLPRLVRQRKYLLLWGPPRSEDIAVGTAVGPSLKSWSLILLEYALPKKVYDARLYVEPPLPAAFTTPGGVFTAEVEDLIPLLPIDVEER